MCLTQGFLNVHTMYNSVGQGGEQKQNEGKKKLERIDSTPLAMVNFGCIRFRKADRKQPRQHLSEIRPCRLSDARKSPNPAVAAGIFSKQDLDLGFLA